MSDLTNFHLSGSVVANAAAKPLPIIPRFNANALPSASSSSPVQSFLIPKLSSSPQLAAKATTATPPVNAVTDSPLLTPHEQSLRKIMDLHKIRLSNDDPPAVRPNKSPIKVVDLSAALRRDTAIPVGEQRQRTASLVTADDDMADDEELPSLSITDLLTDIITVDCLIDASAIRRRKLPNKTTRRSQIGRIICSRFSDRSAAARARARGVRHDFGTMRHAIKRYSFEKPSPDDVILRQLSKWKRP